MDAILYIQAAKEELDDNSNNNIVNEAIAEVNKAASKHTCLLYTSPSPRD